VPTEGLIDQVTAVLPVLRTVAVKAWLWDCVNVSVAGATETLIGGAGGFKVIAALALAVELATLVAVMVTVCVLAIDAGAV
jgi:hypothetical protein